MSQSIQSEVRLLLKYAMNYGIILGSFWFIKYLFLLSSSFFVHFIYLFNLLGIGTLILYYVLLSRYRDKALGGYISYAHCIIFSIFLFLFAGLIESSIIYVHIAIIDTSFSGQEKILIDTIAEMFKNISDYLGIETVIKTPKSKPVPSNALYVLNKILVNVLIGFSLSLIYGIFVRRKKN